MTDDEIDKRIAELRHQAEELSMTDELREIRKRMRDWEAKHGKKIADLSGEENLQACMDVMCLTRREAEEYIASLNSSL